MKKVGFWYSKDEPLLSMPVSSKNKNEHSVEFINKCNEWINLTNVIKNYDAMLMVIHGANISDERYVEYCSSASCRLCGHSNGNGEYNYNGFTFPAGLFHYIVDHNIAIDEEFKKMILRSQMIDYKSLKIMTRIDKILRQMDGSNALRYE